MTTIAIRVIPNAKQNAVAGRVEGAWKIRLTAPPVEGKANERLVEYLSELFDCSKREISLISGSFSRLKRVRIPLSAQDVEDILHRASN